MGALRRGLIALARAIFGTNPANRSGFEARPRPLGVESLECRRVLASLSGYVYVDSADEAKTASDIVLSGVSLTLTGTNSSGASVSESTTTASNGAYSFENLAAGTYTISAAQPGKLLDGSSFSGTLGGFSATDVISNVTVGASDAGTGYNFREGGLSLADITLAMFLDSTPSVQTYYDDLVASSPGTVAPSSITPTVTSITLADANPTTASSVDYTVNFNEAVTGVTASAFALDSSSTISGASITGVTGSGSVYTVAVSTGSASGTIGLNVVDDGQIFDAAGHQYGTGSGAVLYTGPTYTFNASSFAFTSVTDPINSTDDTDVIAGGTSEDGATISLTATDGTNTTSAYTATANSSGVWSISGIDVSSLANGTITFNATSKDAAGNTATTSTTSTKDVATVNVAISSVTNPVTASNDTAVTVSGTGDTGDTISLTATDGANTTSAYTATVAGGLWSISNIDLSSLKDGSITVNVTATDSNGNTATTSATTTKSVGSVSVAITANTSPINNTNDSSVTVSGTGTVGASISLVGTDSTGATTATSTATVGSDGTWTISGIDAAALADGAITFTATASNTTGDTATTTATSTKNTVTPTVTVSSVTNPINDTNDTNVTLSGTATAGATVSITATDVNDKSTTTPYTTTAGSDGSWSISGIDTSALANGAISFAITVTDTYGNTAATTASATQNTTAPTITAPAAQTTPLNTALAFSSASGNAVSITENSAAANTVQLALTATDGAIALSTTSGLTIASGANDSAALTVTGTLADINAALAGMTFTPTSAFTGAATISLNYSDLGLGGTATTQTASQTVDIAVNAPSIALTSSAASTVYGQSVTFTATLAAVSPATGTPTGTVTFYNGATSLGTGTLAGGVATLTTGALTVGGDSITAVYGGDTNFAANTSSALTETVAKASTTTALTTSLASAASGQSVTFTATLAAVSPGAGTPSGTVTFYDGTTSLGTGDLAGGVATFTTSALDVGSHSITAVYGGGVNFAGSTSSAVTETITTAVTIAAPASQTTPLSTALVFSSANSNAISITEADAGDSTVQLALTATDGSITLSTTSGLTITSGANDSAALTVTGTLADINAALAGMTFTPTSAFAGAATVGLDYSDLGLGGTATAQTASQTVNIAVNAPSTTLTSSDSSTAYGQSVTFTATLAAVSPATGTPTGTVTFYDAGQSMGSGTVGSDGVATFTTSVLPVGSASITASYSGDTNFAASTSTALTQTVALASTTTALTTSLASADSGQSVTFTATLAAVSPGAGTPTGAVKFYDGTTLLGSGTLDSGGVATFTTDALPAGSDSITAVYGGDLNFATSTSSALTETIDAPPSIAAPAAVTTPLNTALVFSTANSNAVSIAESNAGSATVQLALAASNGTIALSTTSGLTVASGANDSDALTVTGTLADINAALAGMTFTPTSAFAGAATVSLNYSDLGLGGGGTAQTASHTIDIGVNAPSITVASSASSSVYGQSVTFTATLAAVSPATGTPTGTVTFYDGATSLGTASLDDSGVATLSTSALLVGSDPITVTYGGDTSFAASSSTAITQTVAAASTTNALTASSASAASGQSVTFTATLAAVSPGAGTPTGAVKFYDGTTLLGSGTLDSGGVATFTTDALPTGSDSITAVYGGDSDFGASTSKALAETITS